MVWRPGVPGSRREGRDAKGAQVGVGGYGRMAHLDSARLVVGVVGAVLVWCLSLVAWSVGVSTPNAVFAAKGMAQGQVAATCTPIWQAVTSPNFGPTTNYL